MAKKKNKKVKKGVVKELFDLEIDEVSAVDKPAIGESFYITKSVKKKKTNKGKNVGKKKTKTKKKKDSNKTVNKSVGWGKAVKAIKKSDCTHCVFCDITKEAELESTGMGLISNVCFGCACDHVEKGVFADILEGTFDAEKFQTSFPDIKFKMSLEDDEDEDDEDDEDDKNKNLQDEDDDEEEEGNEEGSELDKAITKAVEKAIKPLQKNLEDVEGMLSRSLELHDVAAGALNEVMTLTFASLDMLMQLASEGESMQQSDLFTELRDSIKSVRLEIKKASLKKKGAKISAKRMRILQEIAEQLSTLLASVEGEAEKDGHKKKGIEKSLEVITESVKEALKEFKEDIQESLDEINEKVDDIEQSGDGSHGIEDEDEDDLEDEEDEEEEEQKSVFGNILNINEIKKDISKRRKRLQD